MAGEGAGMIAMSESIDPEAPAPVVRLSHLGDGLAQITLCDIDGCNGFRPAFVDGLLTAFEAVGADPAVRAVILAAQGPYFCSGGTKEGLLAIQQRAATFTDIKLYELPLRCPIPVIAAMQGHAIGGGFVLGMFADIVLLARESIYTANFMRYGFTPGMGGTFILPHKLGPNLAHEMMLTGANYRGAELQARGVSIGVLPRCDVWGRAVAIGRELAEKPRAALVTLKRHLSRTAFEVLDEVVEHELAMHAQTFHQDHVLALVEKNFGATA